MAGDAETMGGDQVVSDAKCSFPFVFLCFSASPFTRPIEPLTAGCRRFYRGSGGIDGAAPPCVDFTARSSAG